MKKLLECEDNTAVIPVPEPPASDVAWSELLEKDSGPYLQMSNVIFIRDWHALRSKRSR